jgi:hypothetical protein
MFLQKGQDSSVDSIQIKLEQHPLLFGGTVAIIFLILGSILAFDESRLFAPNRTLLPTENWFGTEAHEAHRPAPAYRRRLFGLHLIRTPTCNILSSALRSPC